MKRSLFKSSKSDSSFIPNWKFVKDFQLTNKREHLEYRNFKKKLEWVESTGERTQNLEGLPKSGTGSSNTNNQISN